MAVRQPLRKAVRRETHDKVQRQGKHHARVLRQKPPEGMNLSNNGHLCLGWKPESCFCCSIGATFSLFPHHILVSYSCYNVLHCVSLHPTI